MSTTGAVILITAIVAIAVAMLMYFRTTKSKQLKSHFGPEYDRLVQERGSVRRAEDELSHREKRVAKYPIRRLSQEECERFAGAWQTEQTRFVDDPRAAVARADELVRAAMQAQGYPVGNFDQAAADLSVDHPREVANYRAAHEIALRDADGKASTEDLRRAMQHYRSLFEDLLDRRVTTTKEEVRR